MLKRLDEEEKLLDEEINDIEQEFAKLQSHSDPRDTNTGSKHLHNRVDNEKRARYGVTFEEALDQEFRHFKVQQERIGRGSGFAAVVEEDLDHPLSESSKADEELPPNLREQIRIQSMIYD